MPRKSVMLTPEAGLVAPAVPQSGRVDPNSTRRRPQLTTSLKFLYLLWVVVLFEPQWWIASFGPDGVRQVPTLLFGAFLFLVLLNLRRRTWYPPLLALLLFMLVTTPFTYNIGYAIGPLKQLFLYYVLTIGTLTFVRRPQEAVPIVLLVLLYQFIWWCAHGASAGRVPWHYATANYDGFGPLMVMGLTGCIYCGLALTPRRLRMAALLTAGACVVGLMSSFARGAVLSGGLVLGFAWLRIPRKGWATAGAILLALVVGLISATMLYDVDRGDASGGFLAEMGTISRDIGEGTGADRRALWAAARKVFAAEPFAGVGAGNFGVYAATAFDIGEVGGAYAANPARLYDRTLHSSYFQVLSEFGLIGSALYLWLIVDFWRRNTLLRTRRYRTAWKGATDGTTDLRYISLGLESMMVGFLATAFFYNQLFVPWLYTILAVNVLLERLMRSAAQPQSTTTRRFRRTARVTS